jgi:SAM-dependent methyltransferase
MADDVPFQPHRFRSAAAHYRAGRPAYAPALIRRVAEAVGLSVQHRVLDLGCGPGPLAIGLAYFAGEVLALDPEPNMLEAARAAALGLTPNVTFQPGSSRDLSPALGHFRLVAMGRSFHWMDRAETLLKLNALIEPGGAVALFHDVHPDVPDNAWRATWREVLAKYEGNDSMRQRRRSGTWTRHEGIFLNSPFSALESCSVLERRMVTAEALIDRAFSMSSTSQGRIGGAADAMAQELRAALAGIAPGGSLTEVVESVAMLARRPPRQESASF